MSAPSEGQTRLDAPAAPERDPFHVDAYVGSMHDGAAANANDALVALRRLVSSGRTTTGIDTEERGAVPTIKHASRPDLYAQVSVDRYALPRDVGPVRHMAAVTVVTSDSDQLRTSVKVVYEAEAPFPQDASEAEVAAVVLETTAVHMGRADAAYRTARPETPPLDIYEGPEAVFQLDPDDAAAARARQAASLAIDAVTDTSRRILAVMPTPWTPFGAHADDGDVPTLSALAERVPVVIDIATAYAFTSPSGRGASATFTLKALASNVSPADPMERLRALEATRAA